MKLIELKDKSGWAGWCGGILYHVDGEATAQEIDSALQAKAKEINRGVAILSRHNSLYGWGYVDKRYLNGGYWYPFFIESDSFRNAKDVWTEYRSEVRDLTVDKK